MKRTLFIVLSVILFLAITASPAWAAPLAEDPPNTLDTLGEALGVLGLFAAMMGILAVGTEIVVDTIKIPLGFKSKTNYKEALDNLEKLLPGKLEKLGVGAQAERQVTDTIGAMRELLKPVGEAQEFLDNLQQGNLKEASENLRDWFKGVNTDELLDQIDDRVTTSLTAVVGRVGQELSLSNDVVQQVTTRVGSEVSNLVSGLSSGQIDAEKLLSDGIKFLQGGQVPFLIVEWVRTQIESLAKDGSGGLLKAFDEHVQPQLEALGLNKDQRDALREELKERLDGLEAGALRDMDTYLNALQDLLTQVENRRESTHSPFRKFWYWVRGKLGWKAHDKRYEPKQDRNVPSLKAETAAGWIMQRMDQQRDEESSRVLWLRLISVVIGIGLAYLLSIDAADLLPEQLLGGLIDKLAVTVNEVVNLSTTAPVIGAVGRFFEKLTLGMVVSGLAAAAGSTFWHDQLDRLQVAKKVVGQIGEVVGQKKQSDEQE